MSSDNAIAAAARSEATAAFKASDFGKAASLFARAIDLGGSEPHALHCNRSAALAALERHADALEAADAAIMLSTGYVKAHYRRAVALAALGRHDDAKRSCTQAIELNAGAGGSAAVGAQLAQLAARLLAVYGERERPIPWQLLRDVALALRMLRRELRHHLRRQLGDAKRM